MDDVIRFKIYLWSSSKAMANKGKKKTRQKFDSAIESLNVVTWKWNATKTIDNRDDIISSTFQRISVFNSAAGQMDIFLCVHNILTIMEKLKSLASFHFFWGGGWGGEAGWVGGG